MERLLDVDVIESVPRPQYDAAPLNWGLPLFDTKKLSAVHDGD